MLNKIKQIVQLCQMRLNQKPTREDLGNLGTIDKSSKKLPRDLFIFNTSEVGYERGGLFETYGLIQFQAKCITGIKKRKTQNKVMFIHFLFWTKATTV